MAEIVHGTAIAFGSHGVLLRGRSGSGKSDLALRCIGAAHTLPVQATGEIVLIGDDQLLAEAAGDGVLLRPPPTIAGLMEVRGIGIVRMPHCGPVRLALVVDLVARGDVERLPPARQITQVAGINVPLARLDPFEASAPLKVLLALDAAASGPTRVQH